jgi:hypothetical protein
VVGFVVGVLVVLVVVVVFVVGMVVVMVVVLVVVGVVLVVDLLGVVLVGGGSDGDVYSFLAITCILWYCKYISDPHISTYYHSQLCYRLLRGGITYLQTFYTQ